MSQSAIHIFDRLRSQGYLCSPDQYKHLPPLGVHPCLESNTGGNCKLNQSGMSNEIKIRELKYHHIFSTIPYLLLKKKWGMAKGVAAKGIVKRATKGTVT